MWRLFRTKDEQIALLKAKVEVLRWTVLFDLRQHDRIVPKIRRLERKLNKLGATCM